jgi:hypothetical protein
VTLFGIFLTPVFFYVIQWFKDMRPARPEEAEERLAFASPAADGHAGSEGVGHP